MILNLQKSTWELKWAIAKLLAHLILHTEPRKGVRIQEHDHKGTQKEKKAEFWATQLLVPMDLLAYFIDEFGYNTKGGAFYFKVPEKMILEQMLFLRRTLGDDYC